MQRKADWKSSRKLGAAGERRRRVNGGCELAKERRLTIGDMLKKDRQRGAALVDENRRHNDLSEERRVEASAR